MNTGEKTTTCLCCSKPVKGRTDKKFCDDHCRNNYNNQLRAGTNNLVRNINNALGKNRRILESFISEGEEMGKATKEKLLQQGFLFRYITDMYTNTKGNTFLFCYDHGYLPLENDSYLIIRKTEDEF